MSAMFFYAAGLLAGIAGMTLRMSQGARAASLLLLVATVVVAVMAALSIGD